MVTRDRTEALLHIATAAAANYRREKDERGLLDYDDLIDKTLAMLNKVSAGWVHYKLDRGVDHVLIDEAQDTSPRQWDIVEHIIAEFAAGNGARDGTMRTVFAVGDEKQSIFSFQGAAPREFDLRRQRIGARFSAAGLAFEPIAFTYSFRSGAAVLRAVEHAFRSPDIYKSITTDRDGMPPHEALDDAGPGLIELWPLAEADDRDRDRRLARAVRRRVGDEPRGEALEAHSGRDQAAGHKRHSDGVPKATAGRSAMATCWCWCAAAAICSTPSSRR